MLFTKVKGHASVEDVACGRVAGEDKYGNDCADALAVAGAMQNKRADKEGRRRHETVICTMAVHRMMVDIYLARSQEIQKRMQPEEDEASSSASGEESPPSSSESTSSFGTSASSGRRRRRAREGAARAEEPPD